jgi:transposase
MIETSPKLAENAPEFLAGRIVELYTQGKSYPSIGKTLNISKSKVQRKLQAYKATGSMTRKIGSGRPRKSSARDDRMIILKVKRNPFMTTTEIQNEMPHLNLSTRTIRRRIVQVGGFLIIVLLVPPNFSNDLSEDNSTSHTIPFRSTSILGNISKSVSLFPSELLSQDPEVSFLSVVMS